VFIGRPQEKTKLFRTVKRRGRDGRSYPRIVASTGAVNQFYFYCVDADFGPFLVRRAARSLRCARTRQADRVAVTCAAIEAAVWEISGGRASISRVPIGVDLDCPPQELVSEPRAKYRPGSCPLLVLVGLVIEEEGVEDIVRATAFLATDFPVAVAAIGALGTTSAGSATGRRMRVRRSRSHARASPDRFGAAGHTCAGHRRTRGPRGRDERGSGTPQPPPGFDAEVIGVEFGPEILRHAAGRWLH
jgi:hypothetical protein